MTILYELFRGTEEENKRQILSLLERRPGGRLLDLGCNDGSFTVQVAEAAAVCEAWGIEVVQAHARRARALGVEVVLSDLNHEIPLASQSFDIVHANQVIEHLTNTDGFIREIARVLKPGGYALLSTNNLSSWHNIFSLLLGLQPMPSHVSNEIILGNRLDPRSGQPHPAREDSHLRIFSWSGLRDLAEWHGLRVQKLTTAGYYPFPTGIARWLCRLDRRHGAFLILKASAEEASSGNGAR